MDVGSADRGCRDAKEGTVRSDLGDGLVREDDPAGLDEDCCSHIGDNVTHFRESESRRGLEYTSGLHDRLILNVPMKRGSGSTP